MRTALLAAILCFSNVALAQRYKATQTGETVHLEDSRAQTVVSIITSVGNEAYEMKVKGQNVLRFPYASIDEFKARPGLSGIPFLGPWANRLDEQAFYANGKRFAFNMDLGNVRGSIPIHGFLTTNDQWKVVEVKADGDAAWVTSRLEFYKQSAWMAQFPFAHVITMTHKLHDGALQVTTKIENIGSDPLPVSIGFHPYYMLTDSPRDEWTVSVGAKTNWLLSPSKIPFESQPIEKFFENPQAIPLKDYNLDDVFSDLARDGDGRALMSVKGKSQKLDILIGPKFRSVVVYAPTTGVKYMSGGISGPTPAPPGYVAPPQPAPPPGRGGNGGRGANAGRGGVPQDRNYICFEPMTGITDAMNLAYKGVYKELTMLPAGGTWEESFWVRPSGF